MTTDKTKDKQPKTLISPEIQIKFNRLRSPATNAHTGEKEYVIRSEAEQGTPGFEEWKKTLRKINKNLIVDEEEKVSKEGNFVFNARSKDKPKVYDKHMNEIPTDEIPMISSGTARVLVTTFEGKSGKGGGLNLAGVQLLDIVEHQGSQGVDEDTLLDLMKKSHN
jgi:hypothetical protein